MRRRALKFVSRKSAFLALSGALLWPVPAVIAQDAEESSFGIEEIVVTARKREERLQDVPMSISVFSSLDIERRAIGNVADLANFTSNVEINNGIAGAGGSNAAIFIRGVGQRDFMFPIDPAAGIYVDGVYMARSLGGMMDLTDIERIEVLRGPQGTLFGKNTVAGVLNVISKKPGPETEGKIAVTTGSYDRVDVQGAFQTAIVEDKLSARVSFSSNTSDGYGERLPDGKDTGDRNTQLIRGILLWNATNEMEVLISADYSRRRQNGPVGKLINVDPFAGPIALYNAIAAPMVAAGLGLPPGSIFDGRWLTDSPYESNATFPVKDEFDVWGVSIDVDWDLDNVAVKSITAYRDSDMKFSSELDHSPFPIGSTSQQQKHNQFSQEIHISGDSASDRLNWIVGGYFFRERGTDENQVFFLDGLFQALEAMPGAFIPLAPGVPCPPPPLPGPPLPCAGGAGNPFNLAFDLNLDPSVEIKTDSFAGFVHGTYAVSEKFSVTIGARYTWEEKEFFAHFVSSLTGRDLIPPTWLKETWSAFSPKGGVEFRPNENVMFYASVARGFKSGGWNPRPVTVADLADPFGAEFLTQYEIGLKSELLDRKVTLNLTAYYSDYDDLQLAVNVVDPGSGAVARLVKNAGKVRIQGFEAELLARPAPGLLIQAGIGYIDDKYKKLDPGVPWTLNETLPDAPKWSGSAGIQYRFELAARGSLTLRSDVSYKSKTYKDPENFEDVAQDGYALVNARLTYEAENGAWQVAVFGSNLTDKVYMLRGTHIPVFEFSQAYFGRPREWGVSLKYVF